MNGFFPLSVWTLVAFALTTPSVGFSQPSREPDLPAFNELQRVSDGPARWRFHQPVRAEEKAVVEWIETVGAAYNGGNTLGSVSIVRLYGPGVTDENLKKLAGLAGLWTLELVDCPVTDAGLKELAPLRKLHILNLTKTKVTGSGLKYLQYLRSVSLIASPASDLGLRNIADSNEISFLTLQGKEITDKSIEGIAKLKNLHRLFLTDAQVSDEGVAMLTKLPVSQLKLRGSRITDRAIDSLVDAKFTFEWLDLTNTRVTDAGVKRLSAFKKLYFLWLNGTAITDASVKEIARLEKLQSLHLNGTAITDACMREIAGLKQMNVLSLARTKVSHVGVKDLIGSPVQHLDLSYTPVTEETFAQLSRFSRLETVNLTGVTPKSWRGLRHLVDKLVLAKSNFSDADIEELPRCALDLSGTKVTSAGMAQLAKLKLRTLSLADTSVKDDGIKHLYNKPDSAGDRISKLSLARCQITDEAVYAILPLREHQIGPNPVIFTSSLDFEDTPITDAVVDRFKEAKYLRYLNVRGTNITQNGFERLKKMLPECLIIR
jgi:internalin A